MNFSELPGTRKGPGLDVRVTFAEDKDGKAVGVCLKGARGEVRFVKGLVKVLLKVKCGLTVGRNSFELIKKVLPV